MMGEYIPIRSLKPGMKDLPLMFIVLDINRPTVTKEGREVRTVKVADKTGSINLTLWDQLGKLVNSGDIIRMTKGYTNIWQGQLTLYTGKAGDFHRVGDFCLIFSEIPFLSEYKEEYAAMVNERSNSGGGNPVGGQQPFGRNSNGTNTAVGGPGSNDGGRRFPANGGPNSAGPGWGNRGNKPGGKMR